MHPAHIGDFAIFAAGICSLASMVLYVLTWRGKDQWVGMARKLFTVSSALITLAIGTLLYLILSHDFSIAYVFSYSSTDLPLGYLIATLWGGQEGTFLLWAFYTGIFGFIMMKTAGQFERGNMVFLNLFILLLLVIMVVKSPFEFLPVHRTEGAGLNPLLQNFWMQIHPPIMFVGFSAAVFPFLFAVTALVDRKYQIWSEAARRWTMFAWATLGISLVLGGYWAYETLGWGGFWAWDPVENSSLIPWIFLTTQVHSLFIKRQRRGLMRFSLFVVFLSFWAVLYGTFLTRSGVLADFSVHSFVDLGLNNFLIGGLLLFVVIGLSTFLWRWRDIHPEPSFSKVASRSYMVTLGIVVLFVGGVLVLLGTSAPILTGLVSDDASAVDMNYYFTTMTPVGVALLLLVAVFPVYRWNKGLSKPLLLSIGGISAVVTIIVLMVTGVTTSTLYLLLFGFGAAAIVTNGYSFVDSLRLNQHQPGFLSHVGLAIALIGAAASAGFESKQSVTMPQGETVSAFGYEFKFASIVETDKGYDCHVEVNDGDGTFMANLPHELPRNAEGVMKKPFVQNYLLRDLYISPLGIEQPESKDPGTLFLDKGGSATVDKYTITFHDYEMSGHDSGEDITAAAVVTVAYDEKSEDIRPALSLIGEEITPTVAEFDYGRGSIYISGVSPEDGGIILKVVGDFLPMPDLATASLTAEISIKPLILLFWLGTAVIFIGGLMSMFEMRRRRAATEIDRVPSEQPKQEVHIAS